MSGLRAAAGALWGVLLFALGGCAGPQGPGAAPPPVRSFGDVRDSVYRAVDRSTPAPPGYGLYTVLLTRSANRNAVKLLAELFVTAVGAEEAALPPAQLNLVTIPTRNAPEAAAAMSAAREQAEATAAAVLTRHYDYGQAAMLLAGLCRPERGAAVMSACGSANPDGPILLTSATPFDGRPGPPQPLLVVNLGRASPAAVAEMMAAYRRQVMRRNFADRAEIDSWRLTVLSGILDAAQLLPGISKAYAAGR